VPDWHGPNIIFIYVYIYIYIFGSERNIHKNREFESVVVTVTVTCRYCIAFNSIELFLTVTMPSGTRRATQL